MRFELAVTYDDGATTQVRAGQRECAAWEREPFGCATSEVGKRSPMLFVRYLAYAALKRTRQLPANDRGQAPTFEQWDATVEDVEDVSPDEQDDADPTTPGQPQAA